jgi:hypothetical protein
VKPPKNSSLLRVESLEERRVMANFSSTWAMPQGISFSLVADGTDIYGAPSTLHATLQNALGTTVFRDEVQAAFRTWQGASNTFFYPRANDDGTSFSTPGGFQGLPTRGDIRIGMRPLDTSVGAIGIPFDPLTNAPGQIILNSNRAYSATGSGTTFDLRTVLLQEIGHTLGLGNSTNTASVMYEWYQGQRRSLDASDVSHLQALYGRPANDSFEGTSSVPFELGVSTSGGQVTSSQFNISSQPLLIEANLNASDSIDTYQFRFDAAASTGTIALRTAGISMLLAELRLSDSAGNVLRTVTATDYFNSNLSLPLTGLTDRETYTITVVNATGQTGNSGRYRLAVGVDAAAAVNRDYLKYAEREPNGLTGNDGFNKALNLGTVGTNRPTWDYVGTAQFDYTNDRDIYRFTTRADTPPVLHVSVNTRDGGNGSFVVTVFDASGNVMPGTTLRQTAIGTVVEILNIEDSATYYVRLTSPSTTPASNTLTGSAFTPLAYTLAMNFVGETAKMAHQYAGTFTTQAANHIASVKVNYTSVFETRISNQATSTNQLLRANLYNTAGEIVQTMLVNAGQSVNTAWLLQPGQYYLRLVGYTANNATLNLPYSFGYQATSDPIGPTLQDPEMGADDTVLIRIDGIFDSANWIWGWINELPIFTHG